MSASILNAVFAAANLAGVAWLLLGPWGTPGGWWRPFETLVAVTDLAASLIGHDWAAAGFNALTLVVLARDWWNRKGRKVARQFGLKAKAAIARLVERAREAGTPVPQGVPG